MRYEIVSYRPELREQITELQGKLLEVDADTSSAYFTWKFEQNPYVTQPLVYVALAGKQVVGVRAFYGAAWQADAGGPIQTCPCAGGIIVDPAHRDTGLYRSLNGFALRDLAARDFRFVFNLSPSPPNYLGSLKLGWRLIAPYQTFTRETRRSLLARRAGEHIRHAPLIWRYADQFLSVVSRPHFERLDRASAGTSSTGNLAVSKQPRPEAMTELAQRLGSQSRLSHVSNPEFFAWRFRNPLREYRFVFWEDSTLQGYLVLQTQRSNPAASVSIVDWQAFEPVVFEKLLETAMRLGGFQHLAIWSATLTPERKHQLRSIGFNPIDETRGFSRFHPGPLVRAIGPDQQDKPWELMGQSVLEIANWDLRMIYSDYF